VGNIIGFDDKDFSNRYTTDYLIQLLFRRNYFAYKLIPGLKFYLFSGFSFPGTYYLPYLYIILCFSTRVCMYQNLST